MYCKNNFFVHLVCNYFYSVPARGAEYCGEHVCLSVCLGAYSRNFLFSLHQILCLSPAAMAAWLGPPQERCKLAVLPV